jgi:2-hydroxychromene-2-carboxylate isomerase
MTQVARHPWHCLESRAEVFSFAEQLAARAVIASERLYADAWAISLAILPACWVKERNMADCTTLARLPMESG